ncbi:PilZ domain-containing protein [Actinoplanes sp. NPDC026670]|uniref:PilZ domain-containing protein n=1 Tax=Actinoplanes sp. NPDC026670 TaxID=3154700 RepID=UPI0033D6D532
MPWNVPEVHVSFHEGLAFTGRVSRCPGDLLVMDIDGVTVAPGTVAQIQWTQDGRGCYAAGTVVVAPTPVAPGVYIRVDESVSGVERRLSVRLPVQLMASVIAPSGRVLSGHTADLSLTGALLVTDPLASSDFLLDLVDNAAEDSNHTSSVVLTLPTGIGCLPCSILGVDPASGQVRVRFLHDDGLLLEQIGALLRAEQYQAALRQNSTPAAPPALTTTPPPQVHGHQR